MYSGLYARPGFSATACAAAQAKRLDEAATKLSKVNRESRITVASSVVDEPVTVGSAGWSWGPGTGTGTSGRTLSSTPRSWPASLAKVSRIRERYRVSSRSRTAWLGTPRTKTTEVSVVRTVTGSIPASHICHADSGSCSRRSAAQRVHNPLVSSTCASELLQVVPSTMSSTGVEHRSLPGRSKVHRWTGGD